MVVNASYKDLKFTLDVKRLIGMICFAVKVWAQGFSITVNPTSDRSSNTGQGNRCFLSIFYFRHFRHDMRSDVSVYMRHNCSKWMPLSRLFVFFTSSVCKALWGSWKNHSRRLSLQQVSKSRLHPAPCCLASVLSDFFVLLVQAWIFEIFDKSRDRKGCDSISDNNLGPTDRKSDSSLG